jgi:hypothetical protein
MIFVILFVYLFTNKKTNAYLIKNINFNNLNEGSDNRFPNNITDINYNILYKIKLNLKKQKLLNALEDKNIPIYYKLNLLGHDKVQIVAPNVLAGKLMEEFNFYTFEH